MIEYLFALFLLVCVAVLFLFGPCIPVFSKKESVIALFVFLVACVLLLAGNFYLRDGAISISTYETNKRYQSTVVEYLRGAELENIESIEPANFIRALQVYLQQNSLDRDAWLTLGNALRASASPELALVAYERAHRVDPDNTDVAIAYVNARLSYADSQGNSRKDVKAVEVLENILDKEPEHGNALMLLGAAAFQGGDFSLAVNAWSRLLASFRSRQDEQAVPEKVIEALKESIAKAQSMASQTTEASVNFGLELEIALSPELDQGYTELLLKHKTASLFVFARSAKNAEQAMPLAAIRKPLKEAGGFPLRLTLNNNHSLMGLDLADQGELVLAARVSWSGQAKKQVGDWESNNIIINPQNAHSSVQLELGKTVKTP